MAREQFVEVEHLLPVEDTPYKITEPSSDRLWGRRVRVVVDDCMPETKVWIGSYHPVEGGETLHYFMGQAYWPQGKRNVGKIVINCPTVLGDRFTRIHIRCFNKDHQMLPIAIDLGKVDPGEHVIKQEQWPDPICGDEEIDEAFYEGWLNRLTCKHKFGKWYGGSHGGESFVHEWSGFFGIYCKGRFQIRSCSKCGKTKIRQIQL